MGVSRSDEYAERVMAIVQPRYLVKLAVAGAVWYDDYLLDIILHQYKTTLYMN